MKKIALGTMLVFGVFLGLGANSFAAYYVDGVAGDDANAGNGWGAGNAWKTVTNALTQAAAPSEIWVKAGTYYPTTDGDRTKSMTMKAGVDLYGGFAGTEASRDERNWSNSVTVLSGDIGTPDDPTDNSYHVVVGATARIDGFVIRDGRANGAGVDTKGGGMYTYGAFPITANCVFSNNYAGGGTEVGGPYGGGGVYWAQGGYTVCTVGWYNCTFDANLNSNAIPAPSYGAGMFLNFWTTTYGAVSNCTFKDNVANSVYSRASALYLMDSGHQVWPAGTAFEVADCLFTNNVANRVGPGAVSVENFVAPVVFRDCRFLSNYTIGEGGAMGISVYDLGEGVQMTRCTFEGNRSDATAGAVFFTTSGGTNSFWRQCVFSNNASVGDGGAINGALDGTFDSCAFVSNSCSDPNNGGGAVCLTEDGSVINDVFTNCTFTLNLTGIVGGGSGGAIFMTKALTFKNCAFGNNRAAASGGAIEHRLGASLTSTVSQCTFTSNNSVGGLGGAINVKNGSQTITGSVFTRNRGNLHGGAITHQAAARSITISDCVFVSNIVAIINGGALYSAGVGPIRLQRNVFVGNTANGANGGGIYFNSSATGEIANCVFRDNSAAFGGAMAVETSFAVISNVTAYTNISLTDGIGGALWNSADSASLVVNSILWDNVPAEILPTAGVTANYSCVKGGFAGTGNIAVDPLFADATYAHVQSKNGYYAGGYFTGGTWQTAANNSPAIDAGDPVADFSLEPVANGSRINMGAYGDTEVASKSRMIYAGTILQIR